MTRAKSDNHAAMRSARHIQFDTEQIEGARIERRMRLATRVGARPCGAADRSIRAKAKEMVMTRCVQRA
jgi:hypothetical protein